MSLRAVFLFATSSEPDMCDYVFTGGLWVYIPVAVVLDSVRL